MDIQITFCGSVAPKETNTPPPAKSKEGPGQRSNPVGLRSREFSSPPIMY